MILIPYHIIIGVIESWVHRDHPDGVIADAYDADLYTEARALAAGRPLMVWKQANDPRDPSSLTWTKARCLSYGHAGTYQFYIISYQYDIISYHIDIIYAGAYRLSWLSKSAPCSLRPIILLLYLSTLF